jgi:hypothetical protein
LDLRVYTDPREPFGLIQFDFEGAAEFSSAAQAILKEYAVSVAKLQDSDPAPETLP